MGLLSRLFGSGGAARKGPPVQEVEIHFEYGSTNYQHLYALEDLIQHAIADARVGKYEGHETSPDGSDARLFAFGPEAEAIYRVIAPILAGSPLTREASITLWYGPKKWRTPKRVIQLPE